MALLTRLGKECCDAEQNDRAAQKMVLCCRIWHVRKRVNILSVPFKNSLDVGI
ncbi:hypothetical protein ACVWWU_001125 [Pantoea sp. PA1]|nr:hypothetical protein L585_00315 [Pantoea ananatis BRT175]PVY86554.1 hypothetical protein C7427_1026 [Pantoea ananatis]PXW00416.1 hypothetical protein C7422_105386 [Pantoea ananatis]RAR70890.1 hypothetical protein C7420_1044 [Pantoea ananatis]CRH29753.1 Uncharacterized protein {ECO:0000313/EMBL:ERM12713.1} [Pantoea ananatis]